MVGRFCVSVVKDGKFPSFCKNFDNFTFKQMMEMYTNTMELDFIMTNDELKKYERKEFEDNWNFYLKNKTNE